MDTTRRPWDEPVLTTFGSVADLTQQTKDKDPGTIDDFGVAGVSDA